MSILTQFTSKLINKQSQLENNIDYKGLMNYVNNSAMTLVVAAIAIGTLYVTGHMIMLTIIALGSILYMLTVIYWIKKDATKLFAGG